MCAYQGNPGFHARSQKKGDQIQWVPKKKKGPKPKRSKTKKKHANTSTEKRPQRGMIRPGRFHFSASHRLETRMRRGSAWGTTGKEGQTELGGNDYQRGGVCGWGWGGGGGGAGGMGRGGLLACCGVDHHFKINRGQNKKIKSVLRHCHFFEEKGGAEGQITPP